MTILRASPASWTCERWGGEREREREKRSERCEREGKEGAGKTNSSLIETATHLGGLGDLDDLEGLSCGLNVDLFVRWERGGGGEREKERKRGEEKLRRATKGTGKKKTLLSRVCCLLSSNLLTLAGFALSASPASSAFAACLSSFSLGLFIILPDSEASPALSANTELAPAMATSAKRATDLVDTIVESF